MLKSSFQRRRKPFSTPVEIKIYGLKDKLMQDVVFVEEVSVEKFSTNRRKTARRA